MTIRHRLSVFTITLIAVIYLFSFHQFGMWRTGIIGGGDTWGYYLYLPAIFIHDDLDNLETSVKIRKSYHPSNFVSEDNPLNVGETHLTWGGKQVNKYTVGLAILYAPFFFLAHFIAKISSLPADGYSPVYICMVHLSSIFYTIMGFIFLRKVLLRYFSDAICAATILLIALATNLYYFTVYNSAMAHAFLFALYCLLLYFTVKWYERPAFKKALGIGLTAGLITLIRPTEIICLIIPVFWGITSLKDAGNRIAFLKQHIGQVVLIMLAFAVAGIPQLIYWKIITGDYIYYSYGNETFDFKHPHIIKGLFGYQNGWLAYTPIMYLALLGIFFLFNKNRRAALLPVMLLLPLHIYIIYSWWCWYYINGFGSRPMIEMYALLSIPFAAALHFFFRRKITAAFIIPVAVFFIWLNIFNTYQVSAGVLWSEIGNWSYYKGILGKSKLDYWDLVRFDVSERQPTENELVKVKTLHLNTFEDSVSANYTGTEKFVGNYSFMLDKATEYCPGYLKTLAEMQVNPGDWLRVGVACINKQQGYDFYRMNQLITNFRKGDKSYKWNAIRLDNKVGNPNFSLWGGENNIWGEAYFWVQVPDNAAPSDLFHCMVWNQNTPTIYLDNLVIEHWQSK